MRAPSLRGFVVENRARSFPFDKRARVPARTPADAGVELVSTGDGAAPGRKGPAVIESSAIAHRVSEMLDGRVKTLHPEMADWHLRRPSDDRGQ